jgi:hypothetical protein
MARCASRCRHAGLRRRDASVSDRLALFFEPVDGQLLGRALGKVTSRSCVDGGRHHLEGVTDAAKKSKKIRGERQ